MRRSRGGIEAGGQRSYGRSEIRWFNRRRCRDRVLNGRDKPVATPRQCFDESRILRRIAQRIAQFTDSAIDCVVEIDKRAAVPEFFLNLLPRDYFAGAFEQEKKDLKRLLLDFDAYAALPKFARTAVE